MRFCYCDESGLGNEPFAVMVGVIVDSQRMHKTKQHWLELLDTLSRVVGREIKEFHTRDFYSGNGPWRDISGKNRAEIITILLDWYSDRRHEIICSVINKTLFENEKRIGKVPIEINTVWKALGFHLILGIQKLNQSKQKNKGNTILIFDNEEREKKRFNELILDPPAWSDGFYSKKRQQGRLDQIIDVPYWGDSKDVPLIQVGDLLAYLIRRYVEINENVCTPRYKDECDKMEKWYKQICARHVNKSIMYPSRGQCETAAFYYKIAPECIK